MENQVYKHYHLCAQELEMVHLPMEEASNISVPEIFTTASVPKPSLLDESQPCFTPLLASIAYCLVLHSMFCLAFLLIYLTISAFLCPFKFTCSDNRNRDKSYGVIGLKTYAISNSENLVA